MIGTENRVKNLDEEGYRSLGKMLQDPVRNTVWTQSLLTFRPHMAS